MAIHFGKHILDGLSFSNNATCDLSKAKTIARITNKANSYTVTEPESGTIYTTYGAADNTTFTLPLNPKAGLTYKFIDCTANNMIVAVATAANNTFITLADATADTVTITDIGVSLEVIGTGNNWVAVVPGTGPANSYVKA